MNSRILVIGIGNSARADDGLGWKFLEEAHLNADRFEVVHRYQLQVEDAALINAFDTTVIIDATEKKLDKGFSFSSCQPAANQNTFLTHRLTPGVIVWLSRELYGKSPEVYLLAIEGKNWQLQEGLSEEARHNLSNAEVFFHSWASQNNETSTSALQTEG